MRWLLPAYLVAILAVPAAGAQEQAVDPPVFRAGVDLVTVHATVRDQRGRLVRGLTAADFEVLDRGLARPITEFRVDRAELSLAILFDISGSMRLAERLTAARFAAHHLLSWLEPGRDEAALLSFDSRLQVVAPFTVDTRALQGALGEVDPYGATSLHDAVAEAAVLVADRARHRRALVVLTDGIDTASRLTPAEVSGAASVIDVPVYVIAVVLPIDRPGHGGRPWPEVSPDIGTIDDLARWTGGAMHYATTPAETSQVSRDVLDELRQQYLIAFEPGPGEGWHPIEVRVSRPRHEVRARGGYVRRER
ncbi:MAG: VWA domain-containing protein [Vicinamibacterales bacterium]|nr:VWA domain-containing protein [Vicinamibacterales bacterium]